MVVSIKFTEAKEVKKGKGRGAFERPLTLPPPELHSKERFVGFYASIVPCLVFPPFGMAPVARIGDDVFRVLLEHLQAQPRPDDPKVVVMNISSFC